MRILSIFYQIVIKRWKFFNAIFMTKFGHVEVYVRRAISSPSNRRNHHIFETGQGEKPRNTMDFPKQRKFALPNFG